MHAGVHIVNLGGPGDICNGVLLVLDVGPRIPGFPVIHTDELQNGELYFNRGRVLLSLGHLDEANQDFGEAMRLNACHPHFPHYKGSWAAVYTLACREFLLVMRLHGFNERMLIFQKQLLSHVYRIVWREYIISLRLVVRSGM